MAACYQQQFQCLGLVDQPGFEENQQDEEIEELIDYSDNGEEDEDLDFEDHGADRSVDDNKFDEIVGSLEELLISPEFEELQSSFGHAHCNEFEDDGENKLVYTAIFEKYSDMLEVAVTTHLSAAVEGFDLAEFVGMLTARKDELDGEVFDMMLTLTEFESFKELMLSYKQEGEQGGFKGLELTLSASGLPVHTDEQEDGEERPDLDMAISVTGLRSP